MTYEERERRLSNLTKDDSITIEHLLNELVDEEKEKLKECLEYIRELIGATSYGVEIKNMSCKGRADYVVTFTNSKGW